MAKRMPLVCQHLENISRDVLKNTKTSSNLCARMSWSLCTYKGDRLYYIGLASNLNASRLTRTKPARTELGSLSVYLTIGDRSLRELEVLLLRIVKPKGNSQTGKFAKSEDLKRRFGRDIRQYYQNEWRTLLGKSLNPAR